jgi:hypothetical protein
MRPLKNWLMLLIFAAFPVLSPGFAAALPAQANLSAVNAAIARYEKSYGDIVSDIDCEAPKNPAHVLMCDSSYESNDLLWKMGRLDDLAWVYAYENATKREVDRNRPPRDAAFIAKRDACKKAQCLRDLFIAHTNASLGGESPYTR